MADELTAQSNTDRILLAMHDEQRKQTAILAKIAAARQSGRKKAADGTVRLVEGGK